MSQSHRQLGIADLTVAVREVRRVTGVVGGSGALVALGARAGDLLRTVDFDIGITQEGPLQGVKDFDSKLGKQSEFVESHGFYVEHAGESLLTDLLPAGWRERAARFTIEEVSVLCLAPVDIAINKLDAARPKDFQHLLQNAPRRTANLRRDRTRHLPGAILLPHAEVSRSSGKSANHDLKLPLGLMI